MVVGYARVSSEGQNLDRQDDLMQRLGVQKLFAEKMSGKSADRPQLKAMLDYVREGDTLMVESISRLARSTKDLLSIVEILQEKNVTFISQKEAFDTSTPQGRFVLTLFAGLSQLERENLLQRQREGIEAAKKRGKYLGRPKLNLPTNWDSIVSDWQSGYIKAAEAIRRSGLKRSTFYVLAKNHI